MHEVPVFTSQGLKPACFLCTLCLLSFPDLRSLKRHWHGAHSQQLPSRPGPFQRDLHAKDGMPQCKHCSKKLGSWGNLQRHIQQQNCPDLWLAEQGVTVLPSPTSSQDRVPAPFQPTEASSQALPHAPPYLASHSHAVSLATLPYAQLLQRQDLCALLVQNCSICGQWVASSTHI